MERETMTTVFDVANIDGIELAQRNSALLAQATAEIERIARQNARTDALGETLDLLAQFTREHFGFQRRLLNECSQHREYLFARVAAHCEFRRRLSELCVDALRRDSTVPERLGSLCRELQTDVEAHDAIVSEIVRNGDSGTKLRKRLRRGQLAAEPTQLVESHISGGHGEASASSRQATI
jgi:hypothetical protein